MFFLFSCGVPWGVCWRPKKFQSHSSLKSYTEYWLPPGWLPRRDVVEFAGDCRRALLVGGCEEEDDEDEEDDAAGGGWWDERAALGAVCMRRSAAMVASRRSLSERGRGPTPDTREVPELLLLPAAEADSAAASSLSSLRQIGHVPCSSSQGTMQSG